MEIAIHTKKSNGTQIPNHINEDQKSTVSERVERALKNSAHLIRNVNVHIEDETPDSKKFDGRCRIQVNLNKGEPVIVDASGESFADLLADGVKRIQRAVEHATQKKRDKRRRNPPMNEVGDAAFENEASSD